MQKRRPSLHQIGVDQLIRGKYQPRQHFDQAKLQELADSIQSTGGLLQPIVVRPLKKDQYEIVAGERRWRAAQLAGLGDVSCLVYPYSDEQTLQASIIENISRADLNPIEEAQAYQRMIDEFSYLHDEVAASVGRSRAAITNSLRLLKLHPTVQDMLINAQITEGHGKILASLTQDQQCALATRCAKNAWNVRRLEREAKLLLDPPTAAGPYSDANIKKLETALADHVGNKVAIDTEDRGGGYVRIRFNNIDELEGHFERMGFEFEN